MFGIEKWNKCWIIDENGTLRGVTLILEKCPNYVVWLIGFINREKWGYEMEMLRLGMYGVKGCSWIIYHSPKRNVD